jgi:hypothetical protein
MRNLIGTNAVAVTPSNTAYITDSLPLQVTEAEKAITSVTLATDTFTLNAHGYSDGDIVIFPSLGTVTGITTTDNYFIVGSATNTFQVSLSLGGSAVDLTGAATTAPSVDRIFKRTTQRVGGSLYIGVSGDVNVLMSSHPDTDTATAASRGAQLFKNVPVGPFPYDVKKVFSTNTTATNILCIY